MSCTHFYFRKRIREIAQMRKEIDKWFILEREWRTGDCHNRLLQEYMELTYSSEELVDLVSEKWDKFHQSRHVLKAMDQITGRMQTELGSLTRCFISEWGKHVARKYEISKDKRYGLRVSVQHITHRGNRLNICNIINYDGMSDMRCIPYDDVFCVVTRLYVDEEEIRDEEMIYDNWRLNYENV